MSNDRTALALVVVGAAGAALYYAYARSLAATPADYALPSVDTFGDPFGGFVPFFEDLSPSQFDWGNAVPDLATPAAAESQPADSAPLASAFAAVADSALDLVDGGLMAVGYSLPGRWLTVAQKPANAQYLAALQAAEQANGIPANILVRLCYQESRFSPAAYNASGATGIMQIVPRWNPGVDPTDPLASIAFAGKKLAGLYRMFGTWELALQAYNWGEGNLKKYLAGQISKLPRETANYSQQILADVGAATGGVFA